MWQKAAQPYIDSGELVAVGVVQEQHPDRARLYRQWRQLGWPIFVDALNRLEHIRVVPVPMALDENGVIVDASFRVNELDDFMNRDAPADTLPGDYNRAEAPDIDALLAAAQQTNDADAWLELGAAHFNSGDDQRLDSAVRALERAVELEPGHAQAQFALGAALRRRYEAASTGSPDDAQRAVDHWQQALERDPNHYIFRRRLQQYGPRLDKPYNFYFWVDRARDQIRERGEEPVKLGAEPMGSEIAPPARADEPAATVSVTNPDPEGRINRDRNRLVRIEPLITPHRVQPGQRFRVRVTFRPDPAREPYWNNEADPLRMWIGTPDHLELVEHELAWPNPETPETREVRTLEFEMSVDENAPEGPLRIPAYALYYVCEDAGGVCYFLRQDFEVDVAVNANAPALK